LLGLLTSPSCARIVMFNHVNKERRNQAPLQQFCLSLFLYFQNPSSRRFIASTSFSQNRRLLLRSSRGSRSSLGLPSLRGTVIGFVSNPSSKPATGESFCCRLGNLRWESLHRFRFLIRFWNRSLDSFDQMRMSRERIAPSSSAGLLIQTCSKSLPKLGRERI
jgi:hypothetical protein